MDIPELTALQFLATSFLMELPRAKELAGQTIREKLAERGLNKAGPAFYQLMGRLEAMGIVKGRYVPVPTADGRTYKERRYKMTERGGRAWIDTQEFYQEVHS